MKEWEKKLREEKKEIERQGILKFWESWKQIFKGSLAAAREHSIVKSWVSFNEVVAFSLCSFLFVSLAFLFPLFFNSILKIVRGGSKVPIIAWEWWNRLSIGRIFALLVLEQPILVTKVWLWMPIFFWGKPTMGMRVSFWVASWYGNGLNALQQMCLIKESCSSWFESWGSWNVEVFSVQCISVMKITVSVRVAFLKF